jgi:hypothetical protein
MEKWRYICHQIVAATTSLTRVCSGATWIGDAPSVLVLYAQYLSIFDLRYTLGIKPGSDIAQLWTGI